MTTITYTAGDTFTLKDGRTVVVRKVISDKVLKVFYGLDSNGDDILGLINPLQHVNISK